MNLKKRNGFWIISLALMLTLIMSAMALQQGIIITADSIKAHAASFTGKKDLISEYDGPFYNQKDLHEEEEYDGTEIVAEDISKRTATSKTFVQADGSYVFQDYGTQIHYKNDAGEYVGIDNTINGFRNTSSQFQVSFDSGNKDYLVRVGDENGSISMTPVFDKKETQKDIYLYNGKQELASTKICATDAAKSKEINRSSIPTYDDNLMRGLNELNIRDGALKNRLDDDLSNINSSVYYANLYQDIDIQYNLEGTNLKENIIVHAPQDEYSFAFKLNIQNLTVIQTDSGEILLQDGSGETVYFIPQGYMYDTAGNYSYNVYYKLSFENNSTFLIVVADNEFFETSTFPVVIDPSIIFAQVPSQVYKDPLDASVGSYSTTGQSTRDTFVASRSGSTFYNAYINLYSDTVSDIVHKKGVDIVSAYLKTSYFGSGLPYLKVSLKETIIPSNLRNTPATCELETQFTYFGITEMIINATPYLNNNNYYGSATISISVPSNAPNNSTYTLQTPVLTVLYEERINCDRSITQDLGGSGKGTVDIHSGRLNYVYEAVVINDGFMPINISLVYNEIFGTNYNAGNNWKMNLEQRIIWNGVSYYYISALGEKYFFTEEVIPSNKQLGLKLYKDSITDIIRLIDKQGNSMVFDNAGNIIELHQYPSTFENNINALMLRLTYNGSNSKIATVTNNNTTLNFVYTDSFLTSITDGNNALANFVYDTSFRLIQAQKFFAINPYTTQFTYNTDSRLIHVENLNNIAESVTYTYSSSVITYTYVLNKSPLVTQTYTYDIVGTIQSITTYPLTDGAPNTTSLSFAFGCAVPIGTFPSSANNSLQSDITQTTILSTGDYQRHISFNSKNNIISDYSLKKTSENVFEPCTVYSNDVDYTSFKDTYGDANVAGAVTFNPNTTYSMTSNTITIPTAMRAGTHNYAVAVWMRNDNTDGVSYMTVAPSSGTKETFVFNPRTTEWQFVAIILKDCTNLSWVAIQFSVSGTKVRLALMQVIQLTPGLGLNIQPDFNLSGQIVREYKYNAIDHTITGFEYVYETPAGSNSEYPGLLASVTEIKGSASLTKAQFWVQGMQQSKTIYSYDSGGNLTGINVYGADNIASFDTKYTYNVDGQLTSSTDENGIVNNYSYHDGAITTSVVGSPGNSPTTSTTNIYQPGTGLLTSTTTGNITSTFDYNNFGALSTIAHNGFNTNFNYSQGNLSSIDIAGTTLVDYSYSANQDTITYGNGQQISYLYNNSDQLTQMVSSTNGSAYFNYNTSDKLSSINNANGVNYVLNDRDYSVISGAGTMKMQTDPFNKFGNQNKDTYYFNNTVQDRYTYNYDNQNRATSIDKHNGSISYNYDTNNRLNSKTTSHGNVNFQTKYTYLTNGNVTTNLPIQTNFISGSTTKASSYSYYPNGNLCSMTENGVTVNYFYDENNRLNSEINSASGLMYVYLYDDGGNIVTIVEFDANNTSYIDYFYSKSWKDQLTMIRDKSGYRYFSYDDAGNPTKYKDHTLTWQNGRELASYRKDFSNITTYDYDYAGIRTQKNVNGTITNYFVMDNTIWAEKTGNNLTWYYYDESGIAGMRYQNIDYIFQKNILGDVVGIFNTQNGQYVGGYTYDAWGSILSQTDGAVIKANPFRYRGYYYDEDTSLYYLNSRYYDPELCRFLNPDDPLMLFENASTVGGANLYAYAMNNPVSYTDSTGEGIFNDIGNFFKGLLVGIVVETIRLFTGQPIKEVIDNPKKALVDFALAPYYVMTTPKYVCSVYQENGWYGLGYMTGKVAVDMVASIAVSYGVNTLIKSFQRPTGFNGCRVYSEPATGKWYQGGMSYELSFLENGVMVKQWHMIIGGKKPHNHFRFPPFR